MIEEFNHLPHLICDNLCTYGYHIIDDFLKLEHFKSLCQAAKEIYQQGFFRPALIGNSIHKQHNETIRTDEIHWLDDHLDDPATQAYFAQTKALAKILNQNLFLGLAEFETHFASYSPGSFYKRHVDQFKTNNARKISCVFYLNEEWQECFGGDLKLYNQENHLIQTIFPQGNRFICFNSELPHEVATTHKTRYSIAGWMKTIIS
jgi:SM-20-related protein